MDPLALQVPQLEKPEEGALNDENENTNTETTVRSVTWDSDGHSVSEKNTDWYWILWILAISLALAVLFFYQVITAMLIIVVAGTLTLLARTEQTSQTCTVSPEGIKVDELFYPYESFRGYQIVERDGMPPLLILSTNAVLNPHLFIHIPDSISEDALAELLDQFMPLLEEGIPLSHRIVEYLGL